MIGLGFPRPSIDRVAIGGINYAAIRGREQQLYDRFRLDGHSIINKIRPVSRYNPAGKAFHIASDLTFGNIAPFTGFEPKLPSIFD
jgi:hypothetical protein